MWYDYNMKDKFVEKVNQLCNQYKDLDITEIKKLKSDYSNMKECLDSCSEFVTKYISHIQSENKENEVVKDNLINLFNIDLKEKNLKVGSTKFYTEHRTQFVNHLVKYYAKES